MRSRTKLLSSFSLAAALPWLCPGYAFAQTPYYKGRTITIVRGGEPGGSGDMQAKALIPFMKKYIPGDPTIVIENMPGAAGMKAVNHIYSTAKPDGLSIAAVGAGLVAGPILGLAGAKYDLDKLIYLGSTESGDPYIFVSRKAAGFDNLEKLRAASGIRIGAQTVGHPNYVAGRMFALLLGLTDPKLVVGYGGLELDLALERGEVDARTNSADTVIRRNREALEKGLFNVHGTITIPKGNFHPRFANLPELESFAKNDRERQLISLFRTFLYPRWPYVLPPGTPGEIVTTLRTAMARAFKDPEFQKEYNKLMASNPTPLTGKEVQAAIRELPRDPEIVGLYKKLADQGPIPAR
ncbi:MAG: Bug family tripartite tricarboxylate transporter substrate binding protein [Candidatus Binatia bacterium]